MLTIHPVENLKDKIKHVSQVEPSLVTWVIADLQAKLQLQKRMLKRAHFLEESSVLRASELWQKMFVVNYPEYRLVSQEFAQVVLGEWLKTMDLMWAQSLQSEKTLLVYLEQLLPILVHEAGDELLLQWLEEHPQSQIRWRSWFELARRAWHFFHQQKILPVRFASAALVAAANLTFKWKKTFVFDLGPAISPVEVDLISRLANTQSVIVLRPKTTWTQAFVATEACYERLER